MAITKKAVVTFVKHKLSTDNKWAVRGLIAIYNNQTNDEKSNSATLHDNGIGFNGVDSTFLSSLSEQYIERNSLSEKQLEVVRKMIPKYHRQLIEIAGGYEKFHKYMK